MSIAENIKYLRKKYNLTQKQLAEKSGLAVITIQQYEAGKYEPKSDSIYKLRKAFECNIHEIIDKPFDLMVADDIPWTSIEDNSLSLQTKNMDEFNLLTDYRKLNTNGKIEANKRVEELTEIKRYTEKEEPPAE